MKRRDLLRAIALTAAFGGWPGDARPQNRQKIPGIGVLWHAANAVEEVIPRTAFLQGLQDHGYLDGHNIALEERFPAEQPERFRAYADELASLSVDIVVAAGRPSALALHAATKTIPHIFIAVYDPIDDGLVDNLARPTGNATGLSLPDLIGKRLELFKETFPNLSRVALLLNSDAMDAAQRLRYIEGVQLEARALGLAINPIEVNGAADLERAFSTIDQGPATGIASAADAMFYNERRRVGALAISRGLPMITSNALYVTDGGALLAYGASTPAMFRRSGSYIDRLLKGGKPSDLPVEQPTIFTLSINLATAKMLNVKIPQTILLRADSIIE